MYEDFFSRQGVAAEDYEVFGLTPDATFAQVTARYRHLAKTVHPDSPNGNAFLFRAVVLAYGRIRTSTHRSLSTDRAVPSSSQAWVAGMPTEGPGGAQEDRAAARTSDRPKDRAAARAAERTAAGETNRPSRRPPGHHTATSTGTRSGTTTTAGRRPVSATSTSATSRPAATVGDTPPRGSNGSRPEGAARRRRHPKRQQGVARSVVIIAGLLAAGTVSFGVGSHLGGKQQSATSAVPAAASPSREAVLPSSSPGSRPGDSAAAASVPAMPFSAQLTGIHLMTTPDTHGGTTVAMTMRLGIPQGTLMTLTFDGAEGTNPTANQGLGTVQLGQYPGVVTAESGTAVRARVAAPHPIYLSIVLGIDPSTGRLTGTVTGTSGPI